VAEERNSVKTIRPIRTARDHKAALAEIDALLAARKPTKVQRDRLEVLTVPVSDYEDHAVRIDDLDPIDLLGAHMQNSGRGQKDLADTVGRALASLVLSRRRAMSLEVIRKISDAWGISADLL